MWLGRSRPRTSPSPGRAVVRRRRRPRCLAPNSEESDEARWPDQLPRLVCLAKEGLPQHAGEGRDRPDGADPEHERPLDQITETALEADLEVRHLLVDFDKPDSHFLTQLSDIRA